MSELISTRQLVDAYIAKRTARLVADKIAAELDREEKSLKAQLLEIRKQSGQNSLGGTKATLTYRLKNKPKVSNWTALYAYIYDHKAWDLLQKRVGEEAVQIRWEDDIAIPGVETFPVEDFTISGV